MILSFDSGIARKAYNGTSWVVVDTANLSDVKSKGMSDTISSILETERNNSTTLRFGYYLEKGSYSDLANNDSMIVTIDNIGTYSICPTNNYTVALASDGSTLTYNFSVSGSYTLNIVDNLG